MIKARIIGLMLLFTTVGSYAQDPTTPTPQWRPKYHFTPPKNWTNDPNGLLFLNGKFELYYQHNPFENKWGHMSWGHATSTNLVNWKNFPVAIPEVVTKDTTTLIFSGSAVFDKNNTSGFCKGNNGCLVAIFTADQPKQKKESQFIAYSNDGGMSFTQYKGNPVIDLNMHDFRDPNVFWYAPASQWIMTVSMVNEHMIRIYGSKNLREWTKLSDFGPAGFDKNGWECPSLLKLSVNGDPKNIKWVLMVSAGGGEGPFMQYFVGDFDGTTFKNDNKADAVFPIDYGDAFYAAISWRNAPKNKTIFLGWIQSGKPETYPWKGQMAIPRDLSLKTTPDGIRLFQNPTTIIADSLAKYSHGRDLLQKNIILNNKRIELAKNGKFNGNANWIDAEFTTAGAKKVGFNVTEEKGSNGIVTKKVIVGYDVIKQELFIDCSESEKDNKSPSHLVQTAPMRPVNGTVKIKVLLDKSSLEVFGNNGEKVITTMIYPDKDATGLSVFAEGNTIVKDLKMWDLK